MTCLKVVALLAVVAGLTSALGLRAQTAPAAALAAPTLDALAALPAALASGPACRDARPAATAPFAVPAATISWCCNFPTRQCYHTTTGCPTFPAYSTQAACLNRCDP